MISDKKDYFRFFCITLAKAGHAISARSRVDGLKEKEKRTPPDYPGGVLNTVLNKFTAVISRR